MATSTATRSRAAIPSSESADVVVTCLKKRFTGVSGTINALLPLLASELSIAYVGADLPGAATAEAQHAGRFQRTSLVGAFRMSLWWRRRGMHRIVWHVRRNHELLLAVALRDLLRLPLRVLFTSAAIRRHSLLPRMLIARADAVIATTERAAALVPHVVAVIGHGVDTARFVPAEDRAAAWRESGLPGERGIIITGRIRREKGVRVFIDAMTRILPNHPGWTAVIAGLCQPEDRSFLAECRSAIDAYGLASRIHFIGEVPPEDMPRWYSRCHIAVACPLYEGYGLTAIEAMASGAAVVASRTGAFESMVEPGITGALVSTGDSQGLADALEPLLRDPKLAESMGKAGRQRAMEKFSIEAEARGIAIAVRMLQSRGVW